MRFFILGGLRAVDGDRPADVDIGGPKQRAVLAILLLDLNRVVSADRLVDYVWGEDPPAAAASSLQAYFSNLRRVLEPGRGPREAPLLLLTQRPDTAWPSTGPTSTSPASRT